jgi:hypothetical protein
MSAIRTFDVEAGLPTPAEARRLVIEEIKQRATVSLLLQIGTHCGPNAPAHSGQVAVFDGVN